MGTPPSPFFLSCRFCCCGGFFTSLVWFLRKYEERKYIWGSDEICNFFFKLNFVIKLVNFLCDIMNE